MPAIPVKSQEQYVRILEVLDRVGGTWQGVGGAKRYLLVTPAQLDALVQANVVAPEEVETVLSNGQKPRKAARP
jgi:hypothetical protein